MKAVRVTEFGEPEVMRLEDLPQPKPQAGQVLVSIKAAGVNPVDTYIRAGLFYKKEMPYTPGTDGAGIVDSVGPGVEGVKPGDRVYTAGSITGTYAEAALCKASQVHRLPASLSFSQGACIGVPYATAYRALLHKARALAGESVLVHGATGGVGLATVQLAKALGMKVIGTGGTERGRDLVLEEGAEHALDHKDKEHLNVAASLAGGGLDVIIEFLANVNLGSDLKALGQRGRVVVVGSRGTVEIDPRELMSRDASVAGMSLFNADEKELASIHAGLLAGFEAGYLKPRVGRELGLKEAATAHHAIMEESAFGKIVLVL
ncbi:MAG TPA: NADPH:quinone reductase [Deltaproteobacteria bacterium]|nr:MAG: quinone oxidoreductase [Deltaproteobacteria bacterium GWA2_55_82]OGQ64318.1 MAG: quinone oxidoreductase [Deltaproteobacteria bacterium RIFCSPLOWO2_02_FULL_55_12]OIJ74336.1 MAG: quinone oxidoreductase [Deltaproteobacteria bacterium GWC2_55_46]HBG46977.1 NADPH:quinone reductase [Deltaproteobacteria bacterium]HCY10963.1 NADPH:quinone reductase [Deltaproteobacteria bacterium]